MKGINKIIINNATMKEALKQYLTKSVFQASTPIRVITINSNDADYEVTIQNSDTFTGTPTP